MLICEYCGNSFIKSTVLYKHQRTAKYCLIAQGKLPATKEESDDTQCKYCNKEFSRKDAARRHEKTCKKVPISQGKECALLEKIVELLSDRNSNNQRNINNTNLEPLTDDVFKSYLKDLTMEFIIDGAKGYAYYANFYSFKDRVLCTDKARKKLRYMNDDGQMVEDSGGLKLAQRFFQAIQKRNEELINAEYSMLQEQVQHIAETERAYCSDFTDLLTRSTKLQNLLSNCHEAARGKENELTRDFVGHLSKLL